MTILVPVAPGVDTSIPTGPQVSAKYTLTGPDGTRAVFNDQNDRDYIGMVREITASRISASRSGKVSAGAMPHPYISTTRAGMIRRSCRLCWRKAGNGSIMAQPGPRE